MKIRRSFVLLLFVAILASSLTVPAFAISFSDVADDSYYAEAVSWAVEQGITVGTSNTTFSPDQTCTKEQILTFLWRSQGSPTASISNPFSDIVGDEYYAGAALWAYERNIIEGTSFAGSEPCTRSMAVNYIWKCAGEPEGGAASFTDVPTDAPYSSAVSWAVEQGITNGTSSTTFSPNVICTRAQIVTLLKRYDDAKDKTSETPTSPTEPEPAKVMTLETPYMYNATGGKNCVSVSWKLVPNAHGYEIYQADSFSSGNFVQAKTVTGNSVSTAIIEGLDSGKTYYFEVRAYADTADGRIYSGFSTQSWAMTQADQGFSLEIKNSLPATITNSNGRTVSFDNINYGTTKKATGIWLDYTFSGTVITAATRTPSAPLGQGILTEKESGAVVDTFWIFASYANSPGASFTSTASSNSLSDIPYVLEIIPH